MLNYSTPLSILGFRLPVALAALVKLRHMRSLTITPTSEINLADAASSREEISPVRRNPMEAP
jgi:hypothetical protein